MRPTISKKISQLFLVTALMALASCSSVGGQLSGGEGRVAALTTRSIDLVGRATQRERVKLVGGHIIVRAPEGYCIDRSSRVQNDFVMLGDCNVLRKSKTGLEPYERGLLSVSVGPASADAPRLSELGEWLEDYGDVRRRGKIVTVLVEDGGDQLVPGADSVYWRAVTVVNHRVISLAAFGPPYSEIALSRGVALLQELAANIHAESPVVPLAEVQIANAEQPVESSEEDSGSPFDFLRRLRQKN